MIIEYENYKTFTYTKKQLEKKYTKEELNKYYNVLSFLFQNGYLIEAENLKDMEEQFSLFGDFRTFEDFEDLKNLWSYNSNYEIGKKIVTEEIYEILKASAFIQQDNIINVEKALAESNFNKVVEIFSNICDLFNSQDLEIKGFIEATEDKAIYSKIKDIKKNIEEADTFNTWMKLKSLRLMLYSFYVKNSKEKTERCSSVTSNINDELYGGAGGYNPKTGEIISWSGTNVNDIKIIKNMELGPSGLMKLKTITNTILKDNKGIKSDDLTEQHFKFLAEWVKGNKSDNELARRIVVNILLNGCLTLLSLKYNLSLFEVGTKDDKNHERADFIKKEFIDIMNFCNIDKEYLF